MYEKQAFTHTFLSVEIIPALMSMKIYDLVSWDLPESWEVPLEPFRSKTISGLDLKLY